LWSGARVNEQARALWRSVRGQRAAVIAAVDEPADPLVAQLATLTRVPAGVWAVFLPAFLNALAEGLDRALSGEEQAGWVRPRQGASNELGVFVVGAQLAAPAAR